VPSFDLNVERVLEHWTVSHALRRVSIRPRAVQLLLSDARLASPLASLAEDLLDLLRVADLIDYRPSAYFRRPVAGDAHPLPAESRGSSGPPAV
jgi:hypothetical protein